MEKENRLSYQEKKSKAQTLSNLSKSQITLDNSLKVNVKGMACKKELMECIKGNGTKA
jgi:hypothetical protein